MLHDIKINAGKHTQIAKQGKFINVVLAAGEIEARIAMNGGQTFQTTLVSGMAFPVPQGFISASFSSNISQQTKVWLSDIPLNYSPMDSKIIGSSALASETVKTFYGSPTTLLSAKSGRGKVTIYPASDLFVGGVGLTATNAIKIPAGQSFSIATQGEIMAFTDNPVFSPVVASSVKNGAQVAIDEVIGIYPYRAAAAPTMSADSSVYVVDFNDGVRRLNLRTNAITAVASGAPCNDGQLSDGSLFQNVTRVGNDLSLLTINMDTNKITEEFLLTNPASLNGITWLSQNIGKLFFSVWDSGNNDFYYGAKDSLKIVSKPVAGVPYFCWILSDGSLVVGFDGGTYLSVDSGVTWSVSAGYPAGFKIAPGLWKMDKSDDSLYVVSNSRTINRSIDKGRTWQPVYTTADNITAYEVAAGILSISAAGAFEQYNIITEESVIIAYGEVIGAKTVVNTADGRVFIGDSGGFAVIQGEPIKAGGLDVAIMAEAN